MNIVIANRRFFPYSGPERYMFSIINTLQQDGCTVIPFSVKRTQNIPTEYSRYFVNPPYGENIVHYRDANPSLRQKMRVFANCIYSLEAKKNMLRLLSENKVDLVYILQIDNDISPSIIHACRKHSVPVVMRLSAFSLICGSYYCMRDKEFCTLCVTKNPLQCTKYKCIRKDFLPSFARSISMVVHNFLRIYDYVDAFICPSDFLRRTFIQAGFPEKKFYQVNSFVNPDDYQPNYTHSGYALYFGRISWEKGINYLVRAQKMLGEGTYPLYIVGEADDPAYLENIKTIVETESIPNITFLGYKSGNELKEIVRNSRFIVAPSVYHDNSPMTVTESLAFGKPVVGSDLGGIADQIAEGCGFKVPSKDAKSLSEKMKVLWENDALVAEYGRNARNHFEKHYSPQQHYSQLKHIFMKCVQKHQ